MVLTVSDSVFIATVIKIIVETSSFDGKKMRPVSGRQ